MKRKFIWLFFTLVAVLATTSLTLGADWSTGQANFQRTGFHPQSLDQARLTHLWTNGSASFLSTYSNPVVFDGVAYGVFSREVIGFDLATGLVVMFHDMGVGAGSFGTPTVATVDTTGVGGLATLIYVGNGKGGGAAGLRCIDGAGGLLFEYFTGAQLVRWSMPVLVDVDGSGGYNPGDLVVFGTESGALHAVDAVSGAFVWSTPTVAGQSSVYGPSLSINGKHVYYATTSLSSGTGGKAYAVNSSTGAIDNTWDPLTQGAGFSCGFVAAPVVIDDNTVILQTWHSDGANLRIFALDSLVNFLGRSGHNGPMFANGAAYPDPVQLDTIMILPSETWDPFGGPQVIARSVAGVRVTGASLYWGFGICRGPRAPIQVAGNGTGYVADGALGAAFDHPQSMHLFDANGAGGALYWSKRLLLSDFTSGNRSAAAIVDSGSNDSGVVLVAIERWGVVHAFRHDPSPRPRFVPEVLLASSPTSFADCSILMNVPIAFNGSDVQVTSFRNVGDAAGTYTVGELELTPGSAAANLSDKKVGIRYLNTSPARQAKADKFTDELTETSKNKFMAKSNAMTELLEVVEPTLAAATERSVYITKNNVNSNAAAAPAVDWLTVTDLSGGGPIAPGGLADLSLDASSALLGLGTYFAEVYLFTNEPDEALDDQFGSLGGGDSIVFPVTFVVGYIADFTWVEASDAALAISNTGFFGHAQGEDLFYWNGNDPAQLFAGGLVIVGSDFVWDASYDDHGDFIPDAVTTCNFTGPLSPYVADAHICSTAVTATSASCTLRVVQYYVGLFDGAFCDSMIIQKNVICNTGSTPCTLCVGYFIDFDFPPSDFGSDTVAADPVHQIIYLQNVNTPDQIIGVMRKPSDDVKALLVGVDNPTSIYNTTNPVVDDTLRKWWSTPGGTFDMYGAPNAPDDKSVVIGSPAVVLQPGEYYLNENIIFAWDNADVPFDKTVWKAWLRQEGFYRGDVNTDNRGHERGSNGSDNGPAPNGGGINVIDIVYLVNYILKGTATPWPFTDQGDLNCDGLVTNQDMMILVNFVFKGGAPPVDKNRFLPPDLQSLFSRSSLQLNPDYK